jgi:subtilisin family serine protease
MVTASLLSSGIALADDSTPQVEPQSEAVATATPTLTPTATLEQVSVQQNGGADAGGETPTAEPTAEPTQISVDASSNASTEATDTPDPAAQPSDTPELSFTETPTLTPEGELTPIATEEAELVVPLLMPEDTSNIIPGQYIVIYKNNRVSSQGLKSQRDKVKEKGGKVKAEFNSGSMKGFSAQMDKDTLKTLRQDPNIAYIEPDQYIYAVDETVGDQSTQDLSGDGTWGLDRIDQTSLGRDYLYHYPTSAGAGVHVYVLDSGIRASHTEFGGRVLDGYDFVGNDPYPDDEFGHGTKVAGVIGASTYGVAKSVYLHSVRVLDNTGNGSFTDVVDGINWVIDNHSSPAVINMSLGVASTSTTLNTAVANAVAAGITVVVSAGNGSTDACDWTPASATSALTIGATNSDDSRASFSNYGSCLDLFAPGSSILTTTYTSDFSTGTDGGTSISSPFVAGAAALYLADHPSASPAQVASAITSQATSGVVINPGTDSPNLLLAVFSSDVPQVTLASPADSSRVNQTNVTLSWNAGYIGNSYTLEVDDSDAFDSLFHTFSTEDLSDTVSGLTEGTWYWRVQASNTYGTTGDWSETWSFTVDLTPPAAPTQSSPANGAYVVSNTTFSWSTVADASAYQFEYNTVNDSDESIALYLSDELSGTSITPPAMALGTTYWFVRARDAAGNWSSWSSSFVVTVVPNGPDGPTLTSPTYGALVNTDTPELTWTAVTDAVAYQVELSSTYAFDTVLESSGDLTELSYTAGPLDDAKYYWRVRSKSEYGIYGSWSAVRNFTVDTSKPVAPELISPVSGAQSAGMPIFSWGSVADAEAYQFEYGLVDNGEEYIYRSDVLSTTSIQPPKKNTNVTYYWFARARDAAGNWSEWSSSNSITVLSNTPAQVALDSPANKTLTNDKTPQFTWVLLDNSEYYHLQIADSKYFTNIFFDQDAIPGQTYTLLSDLGPDGVYYWRVRGRNGSDDYGAWSGARYFTLDTTAPDAPLLLSPVDNSTYAGQPTYKWSRPSTSKYYHFKYTTLGDPDTEVYLSDDLRSYKFKAPAIAEGTYYWYAQAGDAAGNWSDWSTPFTITIVPPTPSRPSLSTPAKGSLINAAENPPTLAWNTVNYAETFDLQVSTSSRFSTLAVDQTGITETTYALSTLFSAMDDGRYYWRVRARNSNDVYGSWSSAWYFTVDNTPPAAPTLYTPTNGSEVIGTPTFKWLRPDTAKYFIFQYNTIDDTDTYVYQSDLTSRNTHQPDTMAIDTTYYWFVKARDAAGNWSDWSEPYTVTVRAPVPGKPVLSAPAKGSYVKIATPELSWNAVDYGLTYDVQVSSNSRFTTIQSEASGQTDLTFTTTNLPDGKYYWRVRATNDTGTGSWSGAYYFVVDTLDPAVPVLRSPIDISTVVGSPTFRWYSASGAKYYRLAYNTADDPETALTSDWVSSTSMKITSMDFRTQYYWFVQSQDKAGNISGWSAGNTVIVLPPKPGRVTTTSPGNGTLTDDTELNLAWNAVLYGHTYEYQIDDSSRFSSVDYSGSTSEAGATSIVTDTLETGRWYWHIRAVNENSTPGPWSSTRYITIYPKFNSTFETDADFEDWTAAAGASWSVASGSLSTAGMAGGYSTSANYSAADFSDFTYEADMRMDAPASGESNTYGLVLRGTPSFDAWNDWTSGVYFTVRQVNDSLTSTQYACALAYKITSGRWYYLGGSCAEAVYGDSNNLKVYAKGRTMKFYVNDYLILSKTVSGLSGTKLGVVSWGESVTGASVDAAVAGAPVQPVAATASSLSAQSVTLPEGVTPKEVFNQMKK